MNKSDLVDAMANGTGLSKAAAMRALDSFMDTVTQTLSKGEAVVLVGFGTFDVSKRKQRQGRNPKTGAVITIKAAKVPRFRAGKKLKDEVNH